MSFHVFDILRAKHPDRLELIRRLEELIARLVRKNPDARLVDVSLSNRANVPLEDVEVFLVELCVAHLLEARVFWNCPNGKGVTDEALTVSALPEVKECPQCSQIHYKRNDDLELDFVPTQKLVDSLAASH